MSSYLDEDVNKDGTGAPIGTSSTPANPSNSLNPSVGIKFPQLANPEIKPRKKKLKMTEQKSMNSGADEVGCTPDSPDCKDVNCAKCMGKSMDTSNNELACTPDSPDCGDAMCTKCMNKSIDIWDGTGFGKRNFNSKQRAQLAHSGIAMPDGSFPIANAKDLANAIRLYGHAANPDAAKAHIKARASALGLSGSLPDSWKK